MQPLGTLPPLKLYAKLGCKKGRSKGSMANGNGRNAGVYNHKEATEARRQPTPTSSADPETNAPAPKTGETRKFTFGSTPEFPSTKTEIGRQKLCAVVQAAVDRSAQVGMELLGKAIKKLYEESIQNPDLGELLDAVLAQKATPEQTVAFQAHIRTARESLETEESATTAAAEADAPTVASASASPSTNSNGNGKGKIVLKVPAPVKLPALGKNTRRSSRRHQNNLEDTAQADGSEVSANSSVLDNPPFPGGPSEASTPPATVAQGHGKSKKLTTTDPRVEEDDEDISYRETTAELRKSLHSHDGLIMSSSVRSSVELSDTDDDESATGAGIGVATRASARKETRNPRKRARPSDQHTTPPPAAFIGDPLEIGGPPKKKRQTRTKTSYVYFHFELSRYPNFLYYCLPASLFAFLFPSPCFISINTR